MKTIMTAHVRVPALDDAPATLSPAVVTGLLRDELGYDGLVIADALEMKAVSATVGVEKSAVLALAAGVDALLIGHDLGVEAVAAVQSALVDAVESRRARRGAAPRGGRRASPATGAWASSPRARRDDRSRRGRTAARAGARRRGRPRRSAAAARRRAPAAGEHRRRRGGALARRGARASVSPARETVVLDEATADPARARHARRSTDGGRRARRASPRMDARGRREPRRGLDPRRGRPPALAAGLGARLRRRPTEAAASATRCWPTVCSRRARCRRDRSRLELELREQPEALARLLERQAANAQELGALFHRPDIRYILIASRGSSSNAARYAQYLLGRANRVPVAFATPSLYTLYEQPPRLDGALVIGISQSGESPDVRAVIDEARRQGRPTIAITNRPGVADRRGGGGGAAARGGRRAARSRRRRRTSTRSARSRCSSRSSTDDDARAARARADARPRSPPSSPARSTTPPRSTSYARISGGTVVARGINYGTAFEIALKIRELSGLLFEAWSAADLMHGPVAAIARGLAGDRPRSLGPGAREHEDGDPRPGRARREGDRDRRPGRRARRAAPRRCGSSRASRSG